MDCKLPKEAHKLGSAATYRIRVQGRIDERYAGQLSGLTIAEVTDDDPPATTLYGRLIDEAALHGVLNILYNIMHLPLLSVELVEVENDAAS